MRLKTTIWLILLVFLMLVPSSFAQQVCTASCDNTKNSCTSSCEQDYGSSSPNRNQYVSENIEEKCSGSHENARVTIGSCYDTAYSTFQNCMDSCGNDNACQNNCIDSYNSASITCGNQYLDGCYEKCTSTCNEQFVACGEQCAGSSDNQTTDNSSIISNPPPIETDDETKKCSVQVISDYDGVSADGIASITFKLILEGEYESFDFYLAPIGELRGRIETPDPFTIIFTPDEADAEKNYLKPQIASAVGECIPKNAEPGEKMIYTYIFTVEQPSLFFVHGFLSDSSTWSKFEQKVTSEGWHYEDIDYPGDQDIALSAAQLGSEIQQFLLRIKQGEIYDGKKISAEKVDVIAHSMGGLVTRYYIGSGYRGDIRKFVMLGTPNHGAWDAKRYAAPLGVGGTAGQQLSPDSQFIQSLNAQSLNPDIEYHTIAGTGWSTDTRKFLATTCQGDGIVLVESVKLNGIPLYCTYDAHTGALYWAAPICWSALRNNGGGWFTSDGGTLLTSDAAYGITRSAILTGTATSAAPCGESSSVAPGSRAEVKSPVTLHAYDSAGNHIGIKNGEIENKIGDGAYYSNATETEHVMIKIAGKNATYYIEGTDSGTFGLNLYRWNENGEIENYSFENIEIEEGQKYTIKPSDNQPELKLAETEKSDKISVNFPTCLPFMVLGLVLLLSAQFWRN